MTAGYLQTSVGKWKRDWFSVCVCVCVCVCVYIKDENEIRFLPHIITKNNCQFLSF